MKILKVWDSEYPWDVRAEKVSRSLTEAGHEVHLLARNRDRRSTEEAYSEAFVHRLSPWRFLPSRLDALSQFPAFMNPRWAAHLGRWSRRISADLILVRDLPLAPTAIWAGRRRGIPVVLDMAENYPAMMAAIWDHGRHRPTDWLVRNPKIVSAVERWVLARIDHVIVVVEESADRIAELGVPRDRITVALNTPTDERIPDTVQDQEISAPLRLVYLGLMEAPRGIATVLEGVSRAVADGLELQVDFIGPGRELEAFKSLAKELGLHGKTARFHGFLPYDQALEHVARAHIGLVPHVANDSWNTTIPNKLFDYMSLGLPVLTSDARPAARIVREVGSGCVYGSTDPSSFVAALFELAEHSRWRGAREAGRTAVLKRFNWRHDGDRLVRSIEGVASAA